jgi:hypothetical protein
MNLSHTMMFWIACYSVLSIIAGANTETPDPKFTPYITPCPFHGRDGRAGVPGNTGLAMSRSETTNPTERAPPVPSCRHRRRTQRFRPAPSVPECPRQRRHNRTHPVSSLHLSPIQTTKHKSSDTVVQKNMQLLSVRADEQCLNPSTCSFHSPLHTLEQSTNFVRPSY